MRMMRAREEGASASQVKRGAAHRAETAASAARPPRPAQPRVPEPRLTAYHALDFLKAVKNAFKDEAGKYPEFLAVMKGYQAQRLDTVGVVTQVQDLFRNHPELIAGFNIFLPKGYAIPIPEVVVKVDIFNSILRIR